MTQDIDATYRSEDDKLRRYAVSQLDDEAFQRVNDAGFRWAPKPGLIRCGQRGAQMDTSKRGFVHWTGRNSTAEQTTLAERAEDKAERLTIMAERRAGHLEVLHAATPPTTGKHG